MPVDVTAVGAENRPLLVAVADSWRDSLSANPTGSPDPTPKGAEIAAIAPATGVHGTGGMITVHVTAVTAGGLNGFVKGYHKISVNGQEVPTTFVSKTDLSTVLDSSKQATAATVPVTVAGAEGSKNFVWT